ncbi:MAG: hypothetical protein ACM3PV_13085 [Betaproteobacteria bacterium]
MTLRAASRFLLAAAVAAAALSRTAAAGGIEPKAAFERLKSLAGTWQGAAGHGQPTETATVTYRVASGGSVVQETLFPGTPHEMISMYHLADGQLLMTHYCAMGNQPRMKLDLAASTPERLVFAFDGGTNFDPAKDGHVHSGTLEWKGELLHADWAVWTAGREAGHNVFDLQRSK